MKKTIIISILLCLLLSIIGCNPSEISTSSEQSTEQSIEISQDESEESKEESTVEQEYIFEGTETFNNLTLANGTNKMGDADGPAYCVYSKKGYNKASMDIELSKINLNIYREGGKHVNAYMFLGVDIYNGNYWVNCADAGLVYSGSNGWHIFYNMYSCENPETTNTWYESRVTLSSRCDYRMTLDSSIDDGKATLTIYNLTTNKVADSVTFELQHAKKDGSNTSYLTDFALDYPPNIKNDTAGKPTDDWVEITLHNSDRGIYMKNIRVKNCKLYKGESEYDWTNEVTQNRGIWPDSSIKKIDYPCTIIRNATENMEYIVDLDMNR